MLTGQHNMSLADQISAIRRKAEARRATPVMSDSGALIALKFQRADEFCAEKGEEAEWLIDGTIPIAGVVQFFGGNNVGKSFLAVDLALRVVHGKNWGGRSSTAGRVVYVASEGVAGLRARIRAWHQAHGLGVTRDLLIRTTTLGLCDSDQKLFAQDCATAGASLVIIDTLTGNFGRGSENDAGDMAAVIRALRKISGRERAVLIIHHSGHTDRGRGRGYSSLADNADMIFKISRDDDAGLITCDCTKARDCQRPPTARFTLSKVSDSAVVKYLP